MKVTARFWKPQKNSTVKCFLCPNNCVIQPGMKGQCQVRENINGTLFSLIYGSCSSIAYDPIEKKPFHHFFPGSLALSLGSVGCNLKCTHCQNYSISSSKPTDYPLKEFTPEETVEHAKNNSCQGIAWTYNEPTIWHEYTVDSARLAKKSQLYTVYVTNGYINPDPLQEIAPFLDAMNIDVKAFHNSFYQDVCKAKLTPVLETCKLAKSLGIHIELTYLVIPGLNDSLDEITQFCSWILEELSADTPVHFSRFHPDYKMTDISTTPLDSLLKIYDVAKKTGLLYPYMGNVPHGVYENTVCPSCGTCIIERHGFSINVTNFKNGTCSKCHTKLPIIGI